MEEIKPKSLMYYYNKYSWVCQYCKCDTFMPRYVKNKKQMRYAASRDPLKPRCKWWTREESNKVLACRKCNMDKKDYEFKTN